MKKQDGRTLHHKAKEAIRLQAVKAVKHGQSRDVVAQTFGVTRRAVDKWMKRVAEEGMKGLNAKPKGRPKKIRLTQAQVKLVCKMITDKLPDQLKLPFALWTREAVKELIRQQFKISISLTTTGRYLRAWGFTPQKPVYKAYEQKPAEVRRWLEERYPAIKEEAKLERAEIHWLDETGMRSDHQAGKTYAPKGRTPMIQRTGNRYRVNMISSLTNRGKLEFMVFRTAFNADVLLKFLKRLVKQATHKLYVIVDGHPSHKRKKVEQWLQENSATIRMFFLPAYSPELNPDELVNQDVKTNAVGKKRTLDMDELEKNVKQFMNKRKRDPEQVAKYFHARQVQYAA